MTRELLTTTEAATYLKLNPGTLRNWRVAGVGPRYFKIGKQKIRYDRADIEAWVAEQARQSTSEQ